MSDHIPPGTNRQPSSKKCCFHNELRRDQHEGTGAYLDVWYCPEPQCDFEINLCKHNNQRQGERGSPYCADCGAEVPDSLRPPSETPAQPFSTCYSLCDKHKGMSWSSMASVSWSPPPKIVCPICEPPPAIPALKAAVSPTEQCPAIEVPQHHRAHEGKCMYCEAPMPTKTEPTEPQP
jgi:hypothetical protein